MNRLIIVGAGPIGLHAALRATSSGFSVTVLERAEIGAAVRKWGHVRLFTPFSMNSTAAGRKIAAACGRLPNEDALLTGNEYLESYLSRLAASTPLVRNIQTYREVTAVSRTGNPTHRADWNGQIHLFDCWSVARTIPNLSWNLMC